MVIPPAPVWLSKAAKFAAGEDSHAGSTQEDESDSDQTDVGPHGIGSPANPAMSAIATAMEPVLKVVKTRAAAAPA